MQVFFDDDDIYIENDDDYFGEYLYVDIDIMLILMMMISLLNVFQSESEAVGRGPCSCGDERHRVLPDRAG